MASLRVFVSHSHADNAWCDEFVAELKTNGLDVWYDRAGLYIGDQWVPTIERELQAREIFLVVLTPDSWASAWVQRELHLALGQQKHILGVLCKPTQVSGFITSYQLLDATRLGARQAAQSVVATLNDPKHSAPDPHKRSFFIHPRPDIVKRFMLIGCVVLIILGLFGGTSWLLLHHVSPSQALSAPSTKTSSPSPTPTPPPAGMITEFLIPNAASYSAMITSGPDGNLWFIATDSDTLGRISPSGHITEFPLPNDGSEPQDITAGPDGNLWVTAYAEDNNFNDSKSKIERITPSGHITEFSLPDANGGPNGITTGPDGNLWFTEWHEDHNIFGNPTNSTGAKIGRITPSGHISEFPLPNSSETPSQISAGPDGNLWFTLESDKIGQITPSGHITEFTTPDSNANTDGIIGGPGGNVWFTASLSDSSGDPTGGTIGEINPSGQVINEFLLPDIPLYPYIATGPDGNLWVTLDGRIEEIGRVTPSGSITLFPLPSSNAGDIDNITVGPDGNLWFITVEGNNGGPVTGNNIGRITSGK